VSVPDNHEPQERSLGGVPPESVEKIYADGVAMVQLLGPQDRLLRVVETEHPGVDVLVRGNEITLTGAADAVAAARSLVDELTLKADAIPGDAT
jgi:phosphate starvation-inducible PhoH-like protein